jgi:hypothetical protein
VNHNAPSGPDVIPKWGFEKRDGRRNLLTSPLIVIRPMPAEGTAKDPGAVGNQYVEAKP